MSGSDKERTLQVPPPEAGEVEAMLDRIRPGLVADGGNLELLGIDADGTVRIELQGECATCPARVATLRVAIEEPLRHKFAGVTAVVAG